MLVQEHLKSLLTGTMIISHSMLFKQKEKTFNTWENIYILQHNETWQKKLVNIDKKPVNTKVIFFGLH